MYILPQFSKRTAGQEDGRTRIPAAMQLQLFRPLSVYIPAMGFLLPQLCAVLSDVAWNSLLAPAWLSASPTGALQGPAGIFSRIPLLRGDCPGHCRI